MNLVKLQDTKINTQKSLAFLYMNNEISEREIKESSPLCHCNIKYKTPRNKPTQGDKELHTENCKTLMKGLQVTETDGARPCSWGGRIHAVPVTALADAPQSNARQATNGMSTEPEQKRHNSYGNTKDPKQPKKS